MAKSSAERQREYMERKRQREVEANASIKGVYAVPFFEYFNEDRRGYLSELNMALDIAGIEMPEFENDLGPKHFALNDVLDGVDAPEYSDDVGSLGRAEVMIGSLIDAARVFADMVNDNKRTEIKARLAEIEAADLSDPETRKAALKDVARLNKMLDQLDKQVRWTFPQWKVTG
ncbi:hypothetical protein [Celeribacter sp.]|uniref:hypothetical protein n=1 Tax=Celeribacter sp. TaxID=1890673 RepID=UPI003A8D1860